MAIFENPHNGYREHTGFRSILGAILLGPIYFAIKGHWGHAIIHALGCFVWLSAILTLWLAVFGLPIFILWWALYAVFAPGIVAKGYLRQGWRRVD